MNALLPEDLLSVEFERVGVFLQPGQKAFFLAYLREIQRWNRVVNLTGLRDEAGIIRSLFAAAALWPLPQEEPGGRFLDVGSGAGIPGIPLKILHPDGCWTLLERSRRKVSFLKHIAALLSLPGLQVVGADLQELARDDTWKGQFQVVVSRAALKLPRLVSSCLPLLSPGGVLITQKGEGLEQEIAKASSRCERFGADLERVQEALPPWGGRLRFIIVRHRGL